MKKVRTNFIEMKIYPIYQNKYFKNLKIWINDVEYDLNLLHRGINKIILDGGSFVVIVCELLPHNVEIRINKKISTLNKINYTHIHIEKYHIVKIQKKLITLAKSIIPDDIKNKITKNLICQLQMVYKNNLIHGDLKQENIFLGRNIYLFDFGYNYDINGYFLMSTFGTDEEKLYIATHYYTLKEKSIDPHIKNLDKRGFIDCLMKIYYPESDRFDYENKDKIIKCLNKINKYPSFVDFILDYTEDLFC